MFGSWWDVSPAPLATLWAESDLRLFGEPNLPDGVGLEGPEVDQDPAGIHVHFRGGAPTLRLHSRLLTRGVFFFFRF